jgi:hypothetical protein
MLPRYVVTLLTDLLYCSVPMLCFVPLTGMKGKMQDLAKNLGLPNPAALTGGQM